MGFEFAKLLSPPLPVEWRPEGLSDNEEGLKLELNQDLVTVEFLERQMKSWTKIADALDDVKKILEEKSQPKANERKKRNDEIKKSTPEKNFEELNQSILQTLGAASSRIDEIKFMARILGGEPGVDDPDERVIRSWNMVIKGEAVPVSYDFLISRPYKLLQKLYNFCCFEATSPKKTTSETSADT